MDKKKQPGILVAICALSLYTLHSLTAGFNAATELLGQTYPDAPLTQISLVASIAMFAAFPGNLIGGTIVNKIGFKTTLFIAYGIALIAGVVPFFMDVSLNFLIFTRALVGFAYGLSLPMGGTAVSAFFSGKKRTTLLGIGSSVSGLAAVFINLVSGALLMISLKYVFLYHLMVLVPLFFTIIMPKLPREAVAEEHKTKTKISFKFSSTTWFFCIIQLVVIIFYYPTNVYLSNIAIGEGFGTLAEVSVALSCISACACISGFLYVPLKKICGTRMMGVCTALMAVGMGLVAFGHSMPVMYVAYCLIGLFYMSFVTHCTESLTIATKPIQLTTALGIGFAVSNLGCLISVYCMDFIARIFGETENVRFYFIICMVALALIALVTLIRPWKVKPAPVEENVE